MPSLKAFIVHGHDRELLFEVKDYLQNTLKWHEPIVLEQRPAKGRTIIEKFEEESDQIDVVFVLLTPDDVGGKKGAEPGERARQNVIFELGYFVGHFGRRSGRVIVIKKGDVEVPSDLAGVEYISITGSIKTIGEDIRREVAGLTPFDEA